jgi:pimeloyl-ACP methyl ester carboxylesterase
MNRLTSSVLRASCAPRAFALVTVSALASALSAGCLSSTASATSDAGSQATNNDAGSGAGDDGGVADPGANTLNADAITYRDLATHPGCTTDGLSYPAAQIPGYKCAAKAYALTVAEDTTKPIVILVHGNSSTPGDWEKFQAPSPAPPAIDMISERLVAAGFRTYAVDMRMDKTDDPTTNDPKTGNPAHNMDHGWGVPIVAHLIESLIAAYPTRRIAVLGFSFGPTVIRDALRRLHRQGKKPFEHVDTVVLASAANHGVSSFRAKCGDPKDPANITMAGKVACEMGDRTAYVATDFLKPLNGDGDAFDTPCADGDSAFGQSHACGGKKVRYTTIVMKDPGGGAPLQDEFVSEKSTFLVGATNLTVDLADQDQSLYFYNGHFKNHYGAIRSEKGLGLILTALGAPGQ